MICIDVICIDVMICIDVICIDVMICIDVIYVYIEMGASCDSQIYLLRTLVWNRTKNICILRRLAWYIWGSRDMMFAFILYVFMSYVFYIICVLRVMYLYYMFFYIIYFLYYMYTGMTTSCELTNVIPFCIKSKSMVLF